MAINGRINVDVLFHDTDGTTSLKVVSLEDSAEYTTGKVAIVTGTVGTAAVNLSIAPTTYKNSSGDVVSFASVSRVAFAASGANLVKCYGDSIALGEWQVFSRAGHVAVSEACDTAGGFGVPVTGTAGTASYTLVMYGT